jgi:hypothetical protein
MLEAFSAKYNEALLDHHNQTGLFEWPEYHVIKLFMNTIASSRLKTSILGKSCRKMHYALCSCALFLMAY